MPNSLSPSINSTTLTCHSGPGRGASSSNNNNNNNNPHHHHHHNNSNTANSMRLPSMEELLKKTGRLSERNRNLGHFNSTSSNIDLSSQGFVDLTSDPVTSSFNLPGFQHFSNTSLSSTPFTESPYSSFLDMSTRMPRRSRDPSATAERPVKRRRANDFEEFLNSRPSSSQSATHRSSFKTEPVDILDLTSPPRQKKEDGDLNMKSLKPRLGEHITELLQEDIQPVEPPSEQDKQLADTIKAQSGQSQNTPRLNKLTCIICMDDMVDMTATICGHLFCHKCITDALIHGENLHDGRASAKCPMCRTKLRRKVTKGQPDIIPLTLKLMKRSEKSKGKQREIL